jgi:hypothetical protein
MSRSESKAAGKFLRTLITSLIMAMRLSNSEGCGIQRIYGADCLERMGTISIKESDVVLAFRR